jgi:protease-4
MPMTRSLRAAATLSLCTLVGAGLTASALAKSATNPATKPATADAKVESPAQGETPDKGEISSPAEMLKKLKAEREKGVREVERKTRAARVAYFNLTDPIAEGQASFSLFGDYRLNLRSLLERLEQAKADRTIKGVLITLGEPGLSLSQAAELRDGLASVVKAGKPVFVHADGYDTTLYTIASGASDICLLEGGEIMLPGIGIESMFYKGLFDKVGVKADYVQIGEYKGADESYTRLKASDELRGEMTKLTQGLYDEIVAGIATARKIDPSIVRQTIDDTMVSGKVAKARGLVDHLIDQDGLRELMTSKLAGGTGGQIDLDPFYGAQKREAVDFSNIFSLLSSLTKRSEPDAASADKPAVAVIYAEGVIVDGDGGENSLFGGDNVGSEPMRKAFRLALRDDNVKAVVVRIDSPGGSALASEVMWQGLRRLAAKKPVVISVGGMAASGGYYLASAGDTIYADPTGIVGSIGVVGGKFVMKDLYEKLGINTETFAKGRNAGLFSSAAPWDDRQRVMVTTWMKSTYDQFTGRVMTTRTGKIKDIDLVARGRIFTARQAKELGMVDEIGGIRAAIAAAAKKGGLKEGAFDVRQVPSPKTLGDYLSGAAQQEARFPFQPKVEVKLDGVLGVLSPALRRQVGQQVQLLQLLQNRPVILMAPYSVTIK